MTWEAGEVKSPVFKIAVLQSAPELEEEPAAVGHVQASAGSSMARITTAFLEIDGEKLGGMVDMIAYIAEKLSVAQTGACDVTLKMAVDVDANMDLRIFKAGVGGAIEVLISKRGGE